MLQKVIFGDDDDKDKFSDLEDCELVLLTRLKIIVLVVSCH